LSIVLPEKSRTVIEERDGEIAVTIPSKRNWFIFLFLTAWLCGWAMGEITVGGMVLGGAVGIVAKHQEIHGAPIPAGLFMIVWLCGWTIGGFFAIAIWLYQLKGKEIISRNDRTLKHVRDFVVYKKTKEYLNEHIKEIRISSPTGGIFNMSPDRAFEFWGISGGSISFDYGAKTIKMGTGLDEAEAKPVIDRLQKI
jgi:hypothetical protein